MKRGFVVAVGGMAILVAGLSGCSSDERSPRPPARPPSAAAAEGKTTVTIDGKDQAVQGTVVCSSMGGNMNIAIGDAATGIAAVVSEGDSPTVQSVGLGNVNGVTLGYQSGTGQGEAKAEKDGKTYKISGTATGWTWPTRCSRSTSHSKSRSAAPSQGTPRLAAAATRRAPPLSWVRLPEGCSRRRIAAAARSAPGTAR